MRMWTMKLLISRCNIKAKIGTYTETVALCILQQPCRGKSTWTNGCKEKMDSYCLITISSTASFTTSQSHLYSNLPLPTAWLEHEMWKYHSRCFGTEWEEPVLIAVSVHSLLPFFHFLWNYRILCCFHQVHFISSSRFLNLNELKWWFSLLLPSDENSLSCTCFAANLPSYSL